MGDCISNLLVEVRKDAIMKFDATEDVKVAFVALATVVHMSNVGRRKGLMGLDKAFIEDPLPQEADASLMVGLIVDGLDAENVAEILTNQYWANKYEGNDALAQYILMRGTLLVQNGENPRFIQRLLMALLPEQLHSRCAEYINVQKESWQV